MPPPSPQINSGTHQAVGEEAADATHRHVHHHVEILVVRSRKVRGAAPRVLHPGVPLLEVPLLPETLLVGALAEVDRQQAVRVVVDVGVLCACTAEAFICFFLARR